MTEAFIVYLAVYGICLHAEVIDDRKNIGATEIPNDINSTVTALWIEINNIQTIDDCQYFPLMKEIRLYRNKLTQFPNFCILNATLEFLGLQSNLMSYIEPDRMDCLSNMKYLYMKKNFLTTIPAVSGMSRTLLTFGCAINPLKEMPPLHIIGPNVTLVGLSKNPYKMNLFGKGFAKLNIEVLHTIYLENILGLNEKTMDKTIFSRMMSLDTLQLRNNMFSRIPDLKNSRNSIKVISMDNNPVTEIKIDAIKIYRNLQLLSCKNCKLTAVPNACNIRNTPSLLVALQGNPFVCDYRSKWLVPARDAAAIGFSAKPCTQPSHLVDVNKDDLGVLHFQSTAASNRHFTLAPVKPEEFSCGIPPLRHIHDVISVSECADRCTHLDGCLMFQVTEPPGGRMTCRLTDISDGVTSGGDLNEGEWFTMT